MSQPAEAGAEAVERDPGAVCRRSGPPRARGHGRLRGLGSGPGRRGGDRARVVTLQAGACRGARGDGGRGHRIGNAPDKVVKNQRKTFGTLRDLMRVKSVGVIEERPELGLVKYAKPVGVVGAVTPSTKPPRRPR